jgi:hypothetical protein
MLVTSINDRRIIVSCSDSEYKFIEELGFKKVSGVYVYDGFSDIFCEDVIKIFYTLNAKGFKFLSNPRDFGPMEVYEIMYEKSFFDKYCLV